MRRQVCRREVRPMRRRAMRRGAMRRRLQLQLLQLVGLLPHLLTVARTFRYRDEREQQRSPGPGCDPANAFSRDRHFVIVNLDTLGVAPVASVPRPRLA